MSLSPALKVSVADNQDDMPNNEYDPNELGINDADTYSGPRVAKDYNPANEDLAHVEVAADKSSTVAYLKVLIVGVVAIFKDGVVSNNVKRIADMSYAPAKVFERSLEGPSLVSAIKSLVSGARSYDPDALLQQARLTRRAIRVVHTDNTKISRYALEMMLASSTYLINQSENALRKIQKLLPALNEPALNAEFVGDEADQKPYIKSLEKIVRTMGGSGTHLTPEQREKLQKKNPAVYKEYLRLNKESRATWLTALKNMVFKSGKPYIDYQEALKNLKAAGYKTNLPEGFKGNVGADLTPYTKWGKPINGTLSMMPGATIRMNPMYSEADDRYVYTIIKPDGSIQGHMYTKDYRIKKGEIKFAKVDKLEKKLPKVRKKWLTALDGKITDGNTVLATFLELIYETSARIGSVGNSAGGKDTFGISTLQVGSVKIQGNTCTIAYRGKDGVAQKHIITGNTTITKKLVRNLGYLKAAKKPKDLLFTYLSGDEVKPLTAGKANQAFRRMTGLDVTLHKLRHVRGTEIFEQKLAELDKKRGIFSHSPPTTSKEALEILKELAIDVGTVLGHIRTVSGTAQVTGLTAIQSYIDPQVMMNFFTKLKLRPPALIEKLVAQDK